MRWLLLLIPGICLAQSVPNTPPPISSGLIWTPAQWTNAWQNKTDYPAPCSAMPAFSGAMISSAGSCVTAFGPTLNAQFVNGFYNPCYGRTYCEDTFRNLESITCTQSGSSVIVALAESLPSSYANTGAYGVFGGCGPLGALNVRGGITATGGNGNYLPGDFATVTGGTPTYSVSLSGSSIAGASGILTVGSASGTILLGMVVTGGTTAPVTFITNFITGTGGAGTYQTNASSGSTPTTATSIAVFEVMQTSPFAAAVVAAGFYSTQPGTTQAATTSAAGSGATFSPGWGNWPLYGPVTATGVGTVTISGFCTSCGPAGTNWIAIGHDDVRPASPTA